MANEWFQVIYLFKKKTITHIVQMNLIAELKIVEVLAAESHKAPLHERQSAGSG